MGVSIVQDEGTVNGCRHAGTMENCGMQLQFIFYLFIAVLVLLNVWEQYFFFFCHWHTVLMFNI